MSERTAALEAARNAAESSYSPYSRFRVGAALLLPNGDLVLGTNVENASYGLTTCAERSALLSYAHLAGRARRGPARLLAVACPDGNPAEPRTLMPCGACRQVMVELLHPDALVLVDQVGAFALEQLLPQAFRLEE